MRRRWIVRLAAVAAGLGLVVGCARPQSTSGRDDVAPRTKEETEVSDDPGQWAASDGPGVLRTHGDASLTGRLAGPLPGGTWSITAKAPVDSATGIVAVLTTGDRIVVQSGGGWELFDQKLARLQAGYAARGVLVLDPGEGLLWAPQPNGSLRAARLDDGKEAFSVSSTFGGGFERRLLARRGRHLIAGGVASGPEAPGEAARADGFLEVIDLGSPRAVDLTGLLESAATSAVRKVSTVGFAAAVDERSIVLAEPEGLRRFDLRLEPQGELVPVASVAALSLDADGDVHVVAQRDTAWTYVLVHGGREAGRAALAEPYGWDARPPVVAADHRAYLVGDERIGAFDPSARPAGVWSVDDPIVGAMVSADGTLLVGTGSSILAFDRAGKRTVLHDFGRERVLTAPVLDASGRLLVVTSTGLHALSRA